MQRVEQERSGSLTGLVVTGRVALTLVFTAVETVALGVWLAVVRDAPLLSTASAVGVGILTFGLVVEHVLTDVTVNGVSLSLPLGAVVGVSVSEAALWALWLAVAELNGGVSGVLLAGVVLALLLVPQHTVEDNVLRGEAAFSRLLDLGTVWFSVVEAAGATVWLLFVFHGSLFRPQLDAAGLTGVSTDAVGLAVLAAVLFVEHVIGIMFTMRG